MRARGVPGARQAGARRAGAVAAVVTLAAVAGCSSSPSVPASPLTPARTLTCPGSSRTCTAPGTVRWSVPLPGSASFDITTGMSILNMPGAAASGIASFGGIPNDYLTPVAVAPGQVAFQPPGRPMVEAVDPATGRRKWVTRLTRPSAAADTTPGAVSLTLAAANGMITAYDPANSAWWLLNAATGAASAPRLIPDSVAVGPSTALTVLPVTGQSVALVTDAQVQDVDPVTGAVRWHVPLRPWTGETVIGNVLYADNDRLAADENSSAGVNSRDRATALQRVDLASGRALPALPLPASLRGQQSGIIAPPGADPDDLLARNGLTVARLDPATGLPVWSRTLPAGITGTGQAGPDATEPSLEYLVAPPAPTGAPPPSPGTHGAIWRVVVVSLADGDTTTIPLGRAFPYSDAGIQTGDGGNGSDWNLYGSGMLAAASTAPRKAGSGGYSFTRLEGVSPQTGRVLWRGPSAGDLYVLGQTVSGPPVIIAESCTPGGLAPDPTAGHDDEAFCDSERLYAVNA
jgi:hypothetical protein